jgi:hypothetical protein
VQKYMAFLAWLFRDWYRDITLWGMVLAFVGVQVFLWEGSLLVIYALLVMGFVLIFLDLLRSYLGFQYSIYKRERASIEHELERK